MTKRPAPGATSWRQRLASRVLRSLGDGAATPPTLPVPAPPPGVTEETLRLLQNQLGALSDRLAALERRAAKQEEALARSRDSDPRALETLSQRATDTSDAIEQLRTALEGHANAIEWLASHHAPAARQEGDSPREILSVVLVVAPGDPPAGPAIASLLAQDDLDWELLLVRIGGAGAHATTPDDVRIRTLDVTAGPRAKAHNLALAAARGEVVAYLDTRTSWFPSTLSTLRLAFAEDPTTDAITTPTLVIDPSRAHLTIQTQPADLVRARTADPLDLSSFAHRRACWEHHGGFDETLGELATWDLILRYTGGRPPRVLPVIAGRVIGQPPSTESGTRAVAIHRLERKRDRPIAPSLRVLYVTWRYPQLAESFVRTEIHCLRRWNVDVQVWAKAAGTPCTSLVPVSYGALADALHGWKPDVVHVHGLGAWTESHPVLATAGVPVTVRAHGFEFRPERVLDVARDPALSALLVFPHQRTELPASLNKIQALSTCFDPDLFPPSPNKDPRLVLRTADGLPSRNLRLFLEVARRCTTHRFVLLVARASRGSRFTDELMATNDALGHPVEILIDVPPHEAARWVARAGIYLHTTGDAEPIGMPVSVVEAMATGCHVLVARRAPLATLVGDAGGTYEGAEEAAARITQTAAWDASTWERARQRAITRAYERFTDRRVLRPLVERWSALARRSAPHAGVVTLGTTPSDPH